MKRPALILAALLALLVAAPTSAQLGPGGYEMGLGPATFGAAAPPPVKCPMGNADPNDGCATAPLGASFQLAAAFQPGGDFNATAGTKSNYMAKNCGPSSNLPCRQQFNVAGVDYPIANYTKCDATGAVPCGNPAAVCTDTTWTAGHCLLDPALVTIPGCTFTLVHTTGGGTGSPYFVCGGPLFAGVEQHIDLGPVNGHSCTSMDFSAPGAADPSDTLLIDDIYAFNDTGYCSGSTNGGPAIALNHTVYNTTISSAYLGGNATTFDTLFGGTSTVCTPVNSFHCNVSIGVVAAGPTLIKYSVIDDYAAYSFGLAISAGSPTAGITVQNSLVRKWTSRPPNQHMEAFDATVTNTPPSFGTRTQVVDHTTFVQSTIASQFGPGLWFWFANWVGGTTIDNFQITNNTFINAFVGGAPANGSFNGCVGATFSGGSCSGAGELLFITSAAGQVGYGENFSCGGVSAQTYTKVGGTPPSGVTEVWNLDGFGTNQYGTLGLFSVGPSTNCTGATVQAHQSDYAFGNGHGPNLGFGASPTISSNYMDYASHGSGTPSFYGLGPDAATAAFTATITGTNTLNVTSGSPALQFGYAINGGATVCPTGLGSCPTVTGGAAPTWTITTAPNVGATSMTGVPITSCPVAVSFHDNIDMTGGAGGVAASWFNQWSSAPPSLVVGC